MNVLVAAGSTEPTPVVDAARGALEAGDHTVTMLDLAAEGFGQYMSAAERRAYHAPDNLVTPETAASAALLRSHDALLVCTSLVQGAIDPLAKSWFERVFIPEVSFTFTSSGRVTGALTNIKRVGMIVSCPDGTAEAKPRLASTRSVLRGVRMNASKRCRTTYLPIGPDDDIADRVTAALTRW